MSIEKIARHEIYETVLPIVGGNKLKAARIAEALLPLLSDKGWEPIETAPKDGTAFLATHSKSGVRRITWYGKTSHIPLYGWCEGEDAEDIDLWEPTHWMPLPPPPLPLKEST